MMRAYLKDIKSSRKYASLVEAFPVRYFDRAMKRVNYNSHAHTEDPQGVKTYTRDLVVYPMHVHACTRNARRIREERWMIDRRFRGIKRGINAASSHLVVLKPALFPSSSRKASLARGNSARGTG